MTERDKKLLAIFAVIVLLGGYWFLVLGKKRAAVADAEKAKADAQTALDQAKTAETQGKVEKKRYPVSYSRVLRMGKAIPVDADYASLLVQVNDISDESNVTFVSLATTTGATSAPGASAGTGSVTTCDATVSGGGSAATGATGATGATTSTPVPGPTPAQTGIGRTINKAKGGEQTASADANRAAESNASLQAKCSSAPTLTDLSAQASGLRLFTYNFTFQGSFFNLHTVYDRLLGMVRVRNGHVKVTGRLLQINSINMTVKEFPDLTATVEMTGYALPVGTTITAGATADAPAGATATGASPAAAPSAPAVPPTSTILGGK